METFTTKDRGTDVLIVLFTILLVEYAFIFIPILADRNCTDYSEIPIGQSQVCYYDRDGNEINCAEPITRYKTICVEYKKVKNFPLPQKE